ncbi:MAG: FtsW/RodA/SpoVE family cell cycle protein, partial [Oscillospiraceae bacterium]
MIQWLESLGSIISQNSQFFSGLLDAVAYAYNFIIRWIMPVLACAILYRCLRPLLAIKLQPEIWAYIALPNGARIPVSHWENTIGRSPSSDIVINYPTVSRTHAVFTRNDDGDWTITNLTSKANIRINGRPAEGSSSVKPGDTIELHGAELVLLPAEAENQKEEHRPKIYRPGYTFLLMTVFQILTAVQLVLSARDSSGRLSIVFVFAGLILSMWLYFALMRLRRRTGFEVETIALFLSTLGLSVAASADPAFLPKQFVALLMGFALFVFLGWFIKDLERAKRTRWLMGGISLALLAAVFILGRTVYGARNWIFIGSFSFQPSELVKITFVFAGASTLDRLFTKRNLNLFIVFSGICIGTIALLGDFGTALIFFAAFIVIAFIR